MKRVALAFLGTIAGLVMLLGFKTNNDTSSPVAAIGTTTINTTTGNGTTGTTTDTTRGATRSATGGSTKGTSPTSAAKTTTAAKTYTGSSVDTRYGPVQIQITVTNGKITGVSAVKYPEGNPRDQQINSYAIPQLNSETLAAQSTKIDMVSGATYTSNGYLQSLQSALDQAGL